MTQFVEETCFRCKEPFGLARETYDLLRRNHHTFCCPWGHQQHYLEGESEETKLRRERDRLKQDAARLQGEIKAAQDRTDREREQRYAAERRVSAARGQITKIKNRQAAGVCPCCDATFVNLRQHMKSKHADYEAQPIVLEDAAEVAVGVGQGPTSITDLNAVPGMNPK